MEPVLAENNGLKTASHFIFGEINYFRSYIFTLTSDGRFSMKNVECEINLPGCGRFMFYACKVLNSKILEYLNMSSVKSLPYM